jgi:hypothetical protein
MVLALERTKRFHSNFKERTVNIVESEEADERAQRWTVCRKGPVNNQIKFRFSGTVASGSNVVPNIFDAISQKFAFLELKSNTILHKDVAYTLEETKKSGDDGGPQKNIVDDDTTAEMRGVSRVTRTKQSLPFAFEDAHHASIKSGSVAGPERHHGPTVFVIVGSEERQFFLVTVSDTNLVISSHVIQGNKIQEAIGVAEIVDSVVATGDGIFERKSDLVEATVRNTKTPNELVDTDDVLLMRFGSENNC